MFELPLLKPTPLEGDESFGLSGGHTEFTILDFWRWSVSDLVSNATRGRLAEFIIAQALNVDTSGVRDEWAAYDLLTSSGIKVEVKSAAYLQSWAQRRHSNILFSVRPARAWDPDNESAGGSSFALGRRLCVRAPGSRREGHSRSARSPPVGVLRSAHARARCARSQPALNHACVTSPARSWSRIIR